MTAEQMRHLAQLLDEFIAWTYVTDEPTLDLAPLRWTLYLVRIAARVLEDASPEASV